MVAGAIVNDVTVDYARTVPGSSTGRVRYTAEEDPLDSRVIADPRCIRSQARHGVRAERWRCGSARRAGPRGWSPATW